MIRYSVQLRDRIFVNGYGPLFSAKNVGKNFCKNVTKNLSDKFSLKIFDHPKQFSTDVFKTASWRAIKRHLKQLAIWLVIKLLIKSRKVSKSSLENNSETATNSNDK